MNDHEQRARWDAIDPRIGTYQEADLERMSFGGRYALALVGRFPVAIALGPEYELTDDGYLNFHAPPEVEAQLSALEAAA